MRGVDLLLLFVSLIALVCAAKGGDVSLQVASWTFSKGTEFPGAQGNLSALTQSGTSFLRLYYDFTHNTSGDFNPQYVAAYYAASLSNWSSILNNSNGALQLQVRLSNAGAVARLTDSTGQTFQVAQSGFPLEVRTSDPSTAWINWQINFADLSASDGHWGGANDGVVHLPITGFGIVCQGQGAFETGWLDFTAVQFVVAAGQSLSLSDSSISLVPSVVSSNLHQYIGVNIHFTNDEKALDLIQAAGMKWVRMDFAWSSIETTAGVYVFTNFDRLLNLTEARGLHTLAILDYGNPLYTGTYMNPPTNSSQVTAFGNYVEATVSHFKGRDVIFECWNEPDGPGFWGGAPNAVQYAAVLNETISRTQKANPSATLLTGGLSYPLYSYWDTLLAQGAMTGASGWGTHLYTGGDPEGRWIDVLRLQKLASDNKIGKVWCTEWGYSATRLSSTNDGHQADGQAKQALFNVRQLLLAWWSGLPLHILYDIRNDGNNASDPEHNFGLINNNYTAKPSYTAVSQLLQVTRSAFAFNGLLKWSPAAADFHVAKFQNTSGAVIYIAWIGSSALPVSLSIPAKGLTKMTTLTGQTLTSSSTVVLNDTLPMVYLYYQAPESSSTTATTTAAITSTTKSSSSTATASSTATTRTTTTVSRTRTHTSSASLLSPRMSLQLFLSFSLFVLFCFV